MLYDAFLLCALLMLATIPFVAVHGGESVEPGNLVYQLCMGAVIFAYFVAYWSWKGRTLGMQSWGLQLETVSGRVPSFGTCVLRFLAAVLSWAPLGLGYWWQLWDRDRLAWHDRLSGTILCHYPRGRSS